MLAMSDQHLEPARGVIAKIGIDKVSELTGKHVSRVYRWMYPRDRGGTGGVIPASYAPRLLRYAKANGIDLSAEEFFPAEADQ